MDAATTRITSKYALLLVSALLAAPVAGQAQQLLVNGATSTTATLGQSYLVNVTSSTGAAISFTSTVNYGSVYSRIGQWFSVNPTSGTVNSSNPTLQLGIVLTGTYPSLGSYSGTITLTDTSNANDTATITVTYVPGTGTGGGTVTVSQSSVTMTTTPSNPSQVTQAIQLSTVSSTPITGSITFASNTAGGYLQLSTNSFTVSANLTASFNIVGEPYTPTGSYTASISVAPSGATPITIQVSYTSGSGTSGSPSSITLDYPGGPLSQSVTVASSASEFYAQVNSTSYPWLLVNNSTYTGYLTTNSYITISVNSTAAASLTTGTYQGAVQLVGSDGSQGSVSVTLSVNGSSTGVVTVSPTTATFTVAAGTTAEQSQQVDLTTSTSGISYSATVSTSWLALSQYSGTLTANSQNYLTVYANPGLVSSGTYYGTVTLNYSGATTGSATISVTLNVGTTCTGCTSTGGIVAPSSLTFVYSSSAAVSPNLTSSILVNATGAWTAAISGITTTQQWLQVAQSGNAPQPVTVSVSANGLAASTYTADITVNTTAGSAVIPVTLTVTSSMVAYTYPSNIEISSFTAGSPNPTSNVYVYTSDGSSQTITATPSAGWITATQGSTSGTPAVYLVTLNPSSLPNGLNTGSITFTVSNASNTSWVLPIAVVVSGSTSTGTGPLTFSASSLAFNASVGGTAPCQNLTVSSSVASVFTVSATSSGWLSVSPNSGSIAVPQNLSVCVNVSGLAANGYSGTLNFLANGESQSVPVSLSVGSNNSGTSGLTATPASLTFSYTVGGATPGGQYISVQSTSGVSTVFTAAATTSTGGNWLNLNVSSSTALTTPSNNYLTASVNPGSLGAGTYNGTITLTTGSGTLGVPVSLTVTGSVSTITASPTTLSFTYQAGGTVPSSQSVSVSGTGSFTASATSTGSWLSVSPGSGTSPATLSVSVSPSGLTAGTYNGTVVVAGASGATGSTSISVSLVVTAPLPTIQSIANAASYASGSISPGEVITIFGTSLGPSTPAGLTLTSTGTVATTLQNVQVLANGLACPLIYVSSTQISAVVPYEIAIYQTAQVYVSFLGQTSNAMQETVATTAPGMFTANSSGSGPGAILNQNLTANSPGNPAAPGSVVVLYLTGEGQTSPKGVTGSVTQALTTQPYTPAPLLPVAVLIDNSPASIQFAGEAPGLVAGVLQINVVIPAGTPAGAQPVSVSIGGRTTQTGVTVSVN